MISNKNTRESVWLSRGPGESMSVLSKKENRLLAGMMLCAFAVMFVFSTFTPLMADDYDYSFSMSSGGRVESLYDLLHSMSIHRESINGRYFSHVFAMFFLWVPKLAFNLANAFMAAALVLLISRYLRLVNPVSYLFFTAIWCMLLFCFIPVFGQIFLWLDGSCNYFWGVVFNLLFLYPFCSFWFGQKTSTNLFLLLFLLAEAFLAGAYSETISLATLCAAFLILSFQLIRKNRPPLFLILSFLSGIGGYAFLFFAPGTLDHRGNLSPAAAFGKFRSMLPALSLRIILSLLILLAVLALVAVCLRRQPKRLLIFTLVVLTAGYIGACLLVSPKVKASSLLSFLCRLCSSSVLGLLTITWISAVIFILALYLKADRQTLIFSVILFLSVVPPYAALLFARYIPMRQFCTYAVFLLLSAVMLLSSLFREKLKPSVKLFHALLFALFLLHFVLASRDIAAIKRVSDIRSAIISEAQEKEPHVARIPMLGPVTKYSAPYGLTDVTDSASLWPNVSIRNYYEIDEVIGYWE